MFHLFASSAGGLVTAKQRNGIQPNESNFNYLESASGELHRPRKDILKEEDHAIFTGIHVLDLSCELAGPYCTMVLGDQRADVMDSSEERIDELGKAIVIR